MKSRNKWKDIPCSWIKTLNIVNMAILSKWIYRFTTTPIKILAAYFAEINKLIFFKF